MKQTVNREHEKPTERVVERNIEALLTHRQLQQVELGWQDALAGRIAEFAGSMRFVWLHLILYGGWVLINSGLVPGLPAFDPTFVMLAMIASVEAIFLSTFILITQNRMQEQADRRADLNLQISLLAEHEVTRLIKMVSEIGERMDIRAARAPELSELKQDVKPEAVLEQLEQVEAELDNGQSKRK
jgi:uncharacterized membrane protein